MGIRIGVLSDTHLHRTTEAFEAIYKRYLSEVDLILHAGDFVSPEIVTFLDNGNFHGVQGNMDPIEIKYILPEKTVIELEGYRIGLIHGWGSSEGLETRIRSAFRHADAIVYGHSHHPANHIREGVLFFNPGTATGFAYKGKHSLGILEIGETITGKIIEID